LKLFESGKVVDTFRDINASGSDKAEEYTQGLTHRLNNLGVKRETLHSAF
jgi:hypothetical protein